MTKTPGNLPPPPLPAATLANLHHQQQQQQQQQHQQQVAGLANFPFPPPIPTTAAVNVAALGSQQNNSNSNSSNNQRPIRPNQTPDFVRKLYTILEDPQSKDCIVWSANEDSIIVTDPNTFALSILPLHFKHNKFASFVRQLNKHCFHRVKLQPDSVYGAQAYEYQHEMFKRGRRDLLENINRQPSPVPASRIARSPAVATLANANNTQTLEGMATLPFDSPSSSRKPESSSTVIASTSGRQRLTMSQVDGHLDSLEQGQRRSFYQIKDLERRIDFFERELGSCRYIVESQSRIIKDLLASIPQEVGRKHPELDSLVSELQHHWQEPSFDPSPYHPSNYHQNFQSRLPNTASSSLIDSNMLGASTTPQMANNSMQPFVDSFPSNLFQTSSGMGGNGGEGDSNGTSRLNSGPQSANTSYGANGGAVGPNGNHGIPLMDSHSNERFPFNNQPLGHLNHVPAAASRPNSLSALNILILVTHNREQRLISDLLIELNCLSFKFAVDIAHVFHCLQEQINFHVLFLDKVYESESLLSRLRHSNPSLLVIFLAEELTPPPLDDLITLVIQKPPTINELSTVFTRYLAG